MWLFLLGCSTFDALTPSEPVRGPIPSLVEVDGVQEAVAVVRRMPPPEPLADVNDADLLDDLRPPYVDDVRAQILGDLDDPLLRELVERWADDPALPGYRQLLDQLLQDEEVCEAVLGFDDGTLGAEAYDGCPWPMRGAIVARYPSAADRDAWQLTPLPDHLAIAFIEGSWVPDAVVRNYPPSGRVTRALERCADDAELQATTASCLASLAATDWSAARARRHLLVDGPLKEGFERFATGREVEDWLDAQGFPPRPDDAPVEAGSLMDRLRRRGACWTTLTGPARLPLLLEQLGVDDAPVRFQPTQAGRYRTVHVHQGGERLRFLLDRDYGADIEQLVGIANRVAREAKAPARALWTEDPGLGWVAVTGPVAALEALLDEELVVPMVPLYREGIEYVGAPEEAPADTGSNPFQLFD